MANSQLLPKWLNLKLCLVLLCCISWGSTAPSSEGENIAGLKLTPGKAYTYNFETSTVSELAGTSDETNSIKIQGQVQISLIAGTTNEFALKVSKISGETTGSKITDSSLAPLLSYSVKFTYKNGDVKQFYISESDPVWSVNIKRSLVSLYVNHAIGGDRQKGFYLENDISGSSCPTDYEVNNGIYKKERDLNACYKRDGGWSVHYGIPTPSRPTDPHSDTTIISKQTCEQSYDNSILKSASCKETHQVRLLSSSNGQGGGRATVESKLDFVSTQAGPVQTDASKESSIHFDHHDNHADESNDVLRAAGELCSQVQGGRLTTDTSSSVLSLRHKMSHTSESQLKAAYSSFLQSCTETKAHKLFVNAASMAATTDSISFVSDLIKQGKLCSKSQRLFRFYATFANNPGVKAITAVESLLQLNEPKYIITASGIARKFCVSNPSCETDNSYKSLVNVIASKAENCLSQDENKVSIVALQALGNLEKQTDASIQTITNCFKGTNHIRINALQAFRSNPCVETLQNGAKTIFANKENSADVRIHAYLAISKCYNKEVSNFVMDVLQHEESLQVLSFIKSHRENYWAEHGNHYDEHIPEPKVPVTDPRKFSKNFDLESSEIDGVIFTSDSNVIYSKDSFLPRTLSSNISVEMYGHEFNLFEFGINLANAEDIFESFFRKEKHDASNPLRRTKRRGRHGARADPFTINKNELQKIQSGLESVTPTNEPSDLYLRILGTTVYAGDFDINEVIDPEHSDFGSLVQEALKGKEVDFTTPIPLPGDELIVPTISGLPLKIHTEGVAILSMKYSHTLTEDLKEFNPHLIPSASITNQMRLLVGEGFATVGLEAETKIAASTDIDVKGVLGSDANGYSYEVRLSLPRDKAELVTISNQLWWVEGENKRPIKAGVTQDHQCCHEVLGMKFCASASLPPRSSKTVPHFPLSGNGKISLTMEKLDSKLTEILFKASYGKDNTEERTLQIIFDTPNSEVPRHYELVGKISHSGALLSYNSPGLNTEVKYTQGYNGAVRSDVFSFKFDGKEYSTKLDSKFVNTKESTDVLLRQEINIPGKPTLEVFSLKFVKQSAFDGKELTKRSSVGEFTLSDISSGSTTPLFKLSGSTDKRLSSGKIQSLKLTDIELYYRGTKLIALNGESKKIAGNKLTLDLNAKLNYGNVKEDAKVFGELEQIEEGTIKGVSFKGKISSSMASFINSDIVFERKVDTTGFFKYRVLKLDAIRPDGGGSIGIDSTIDTRDGKIEVTQKHHVTCKENDIDRKLDITFSKAYPTVKFTYTTFSGSDKYFKLNSDINLDSKVYSVEGSVASPTTKGTFSISKTKNDDEENYEYSINMDHKAVHLQGKINTNVYTKQEGGKTWRFRETTIVSNHLSKEFKVKIKYDSDSSSKAPQILRSAGTLEVSASLPDIEGETTLVIIRKKEPRSINVNLQVGKITKVEFNAERSGDRLIDMKATLDDLKSNTKMFSLGTKVQTNIGVRSSETYLNLYFDLIAGPKKFSVESENKLSPGQTDVTIESKNTVNLDGPTKVDIKIVAGRALSKEHSVNIDYSTTQKSLKLSLVSTWDIDVDTKLVKFQANLQENGIAKWNGKSEFGFRKFRPETREYEFVNIVEVNGGAGSKEKLAEVNFVLETSGGEEVPYVLLISLALGGKMPPLKYTFRSEYGNGKLAIKLLGTRNNVQKLLKLSVEKNTEHEHKKYSIAFTKDFNYVEGHDPELDLTWAYDYRYNGITDMEISETFKMASTLLGEPNKIEALGIVLVSSNKFSYKSKLAIQEGSRPEKILRDINIEWNAESSKDFSGSIDVNLPVLGELLNNPSKSIFKITVSLKEGSTFSFNAYFPSHSYEVVKLDVNKKKQGNLKTVVLIGQLDDKTLNINSKYEYSPTKKYLDLSAGLNNDPINRLVIQYDNPSSNPSIKATVELNGKTYSSTGKLDNFPNGFKANFDFNGKWSLEVSRREAQRSKTLSLIANNQGTNEKLELSYSKDSSALGLRIKGQASVKLDILQRFITKINPANGIDGGFDLDISFGKNFDLMTNLAFENQSWKNRVYGSKEENEKEFIFNLCPSSGTGPYCTDVRAEMESKGDDKKFGVSLKFGSFDGNVKLTASKEEKKVEVSYSKDGRPLSTSVRIYKQYGTEQDLDLLKENVKGAGKSKKHGIEVVLPDRTLSAVLTKVRYNEVDAKAMEVNLWFDAKNHPDKKLAFGFSAIDANVQEEMQGRDVFYALKHPLLSRPLKVHGHLRYGISNKVFISTTEWDIFNAENKKVFVSTELTHNVASNSFNLESTVKSEGQGFLLETKCTDIKIDYPDYEITCQSTTKSPGNPDRIDHAYIKSTRNEYFLKADSNGKEYYYKHTINLQDGVRKDPFSNSEVEHFIPRISVEIQLPGVETPRVISFQGIETPFGYSLISKTGTEENKERTEFWVGRVSPVKCGFGADYYNDKNEKSGLFDVLFTKHNKQMYVELDWNKDAIKSFTERKLKVQEERYSKIIKAYDDDYDNSIQHLNSISEAMSKSSIDFTPLLQWYETNINDMSDKYRVPPNKISLKGFGSNRYSNIVAAIFEPFKTMFVKMLRGIQLISQTGFNTLNARLESASSLSPKPNPTNVDNQVQAVSKCAQTVASKIREYVAKVKPLKEKYEILNKIGTKFREIIVSKVQSTYKLTKEDIEQLLPYSNVHSFLEDFQEYIGTALLKPNEITPTNRAKIISEFEEAVKEILLNSYSMNFQKGEILFKVPLVTEASSLKTLFKRKGSHKHTGGECIRDMSVLPPVGATGLIFYEANHVRTFDGKDINFKATRCKYLLATDVSTNNFSVAIQLGSGDDRKLFLVDNRVTFVITDDALYVDGNANPWTRYAGGETINGYAVKYDADYLILASPHGLTVGCSSDREVCAVQLEGYYHGKVNGLLGKYNNEEYDDAVSTDAKALADAWRIGSTCKEQYSTTYLHGRPDMDYDYFFTTSKTSPHRNVGGFYSGSSGLNPSALSLFMALITLLFLSKLF